MLDIKFIRENPDAVRETLQKRGMEADVERLIAADDSRRDLLYEVEQLRADRNRTSEAIAAKKKQKEDASEDVERMRGVSAKIKEIESRVREVESEFRTLMLGVPNIPDETVPVGVEESDNRVEWSWGEPPEFDFEPKHHADLGEELGILDFKRSGKLSGTRFAVYRGPGAQLERALITFMLDLHTQEHGYEEYLPPFLVTSQTMEGTGQLPKFAEDSFKCEGHDLWLIPTAEVPLTNLHRDEILDGRQLPLRYVAFTPCFRAEAGAHGKDTRGLIRNHQFNKVELVKFSAPDNSYDELESLTKNAEEVLKRLELPYRVVSLCSGDLGFSAAKTYDIEVWLPGQERYREISSCSNFTDFQARRANIKFRREPKARPEHVHTLNGSGLAVGRTLVAVLENFQQKNGTVIVPEALQPYMGGLSKIERIR